MNPLLSSLLSALAPLFRKRDTWYIGCILLLVGVLWLAHLKLRAAELALATKPKVEYVKQIFEKTVTTAGPERVVEKIREIPGGERIIERVVYRDTVKTETGTETKVDRKEEAACPPAASRKRYVGLALDPLNTQRPRLRAGLTIWNRFDLGGAYDSRFAPNQGALQIEAAYRF